MTSEHRIDAQAQFLTLGSVAQILEPVLVRVEGIYAEDKPFLSFELDSRQPLKDRVFVAIKGERFDGSEFIEKAYEAQAVAAITERAAPCPLPQFVVTDARQAYGLIARAWRRLWQGRIVAVGGSNGKTTTTQMIAAIMRHIGCPDLMHATSGNFNNEIGVPKTLLALPAHAKMAVVEAGMNHPGEMARLAYWIEPNIALITNAQREHQAFLKGVEATAYENGLLIVALPAGRTAVYPVDDPCHTIWASQATARGARHLTYSIDEAHRADVQGVYDEAKSELAVTYEGKTERVTLQTKGLHNAHNATGAVAAMLGLGASLRIAVAGLADFKPLKGRGECVEYAHLNLTLQDESYNANPDSVRAAEAVLATSDKPKRWMIFGDMAELGDDKIQNHAEIGQYAKALGIEAFWCAGPLSKNAALAFGPQARHFASKDELMQAITVEALRDVAIVVKASNSMGFKDIVSHIQTLAAQAVKPQS